MKILTMAKRVPDPEAKVKIKVDGSSIVTDQLKHVINPFDEIAVEEALRVKEKLGGEIVVISIGPKEATEQIRTALAMGTDRGILVITDGDYLDPKVTAEIMAKIAKEEAFDMILMGKQAVDTDYGQVCGMLAHLLNVPHASFAYKLEIDEGNKKVKVMREVDGGIETKIIGLPCIISADLRLNEPRYASLPGIMKAKKKEIKQFKISELGIDANTFLKIEKLEEPPKREGGRKVESVQELVRYLHEEAKVL